jgi:hypothetical protein
MNIIYLLDYYGGFVKYTRNCIQCHLHLEHCERIADGDLMLLGRIRDMGAKRHTQVSSLLNLISSCRGIIEWILTSMLLKLDT